MRHLGASAAHVSLLELPGLMIGWNHQLEVASFRRWSVKTLSETSSVMIISADIDVCVEYVLDGLSRASKKRACTRKHSLSPALTYRDCMPVHGISVLDKTICSKQELCWGRLADDPGISCRGRSALSADQATLMC